ncbi:MAG: hypothetical protein CFH41_00294 [Alphaproteobacteria bacterium MarineAlpha11_Bin1]|nr:MAG: hypothetical protein CFH41_00294 [Alphaproteobacteria bacterium MarineAlpha11_Bin1]|tara:strand:- start:9037 stop:9774 length:738 start_codon:yes stop_codon:yes gene_type:complete
MSNINYDDSPYSVREDIVEAHQRAWDRLSKAGNWLTGEERLKVMAEARHARDCPGYAKIREALSPFSITEPFDSGTDLPQNWVNMIHLIVADPGRLTQTWYKKTIDSGILETHFVEIVSIVAHTTAIDTFANGIGVPVRALPEAQSGEPSYYRPAEARQHQAWSPNIAWDEYGPNEADYFVGPESNIRRALTLVPDEARGFFDVVAAQYLSGPEMRDFTQEFRAITHLQIELLAARVSALNQCTY